MRYGLFRPEVQGREFALVASVALVGRVRVRRFLAAGLVAGVFFGGAAGHSSAQATRKPVRRPRRETNASREARIARTIQATYAHQWEIAGGGGYLRWRSGESTKRNNEISWNTTASYYLNPKLAIVGDAQGSFGNAHQQLASGDSTTDQFYFAQVPNPQINEYFFTGGVNYRFIRKENVAVSVQGTGGTAWGIFSGGAKGLTGPEVGLWHDGFRPAAKIAVNVDYNFYPNLAFRVSPTYILTNFQYTPEIDAINAAQTGVAPTYSGAIQNNLGINFAVLYRFGRQK